MYLISHKIRPNKLLHHLIMPVIYPILAGCKAPIAKHQVEPSCLSEEQQPEKPYQSERGGITFT